MKRNLPCDFCFMTPRETPRETTTLLPAQRKLLRKVSQDNFCARTLYAQ